LQPPDLRDRSAHKGRNAEKWTALPLFQRIRPKPDRLLHLRMGILIGAPPTSISIFNAFFDE
jgi:hypothetical protein